MLFSKRALWVLALAVAATVLTPVAGFCIEEDLYVYRLLFARVYFEYETGTVDDSGRSRERDRFLQTYTLDTLGNILSRRLITYDAGVSFTFEDYEQDSSTRDTERVNYYLKTTLLPKSNIPLSLYGSRMNHTLTTNTSESERTQTILGLNWLMRFRTLPDTRLAIERQHDTATSSDSTTTAYTLIMNKDIGPSHNSLSVNYDTSEDNINDGRGTQSLTINATNKTNLSRTTIFDFGYARGDTSTEAEDSPDTTVNAVTVGLQSRPSLEFNQNHRYTFYSLETDGSESANHQYTGNMGYRFTDRLDSTLSLTAGETTTESVDKTESTTTLGAGFGLNYRISQKLSLSETVTYSKFDTTSETATNLDRELFRALTHLTYNDILSWAQLLASARLGYNRDRTSDEFAGSGIEQGFSASLTNIDINRYFIFNTSADWNRVYNLSGDVWSKASNYQVSAINKLWRRYVQLTAKMSRSAQSSWIEADEKTTENWGLSAISTYFRNTKIEATSEHNKSFDTVTGDISNDSEMLTVIHNRYLAGGAMDIGFNYTLVSNTFPGGSNRFSSYGLFARYNKKLLRNLDWRAGASITRGEGSNDVFRNITTFDNTFTYPLRSWLLSFEQKYIKTEDQNRDLTETTYLFRALRQFAWFL